MTEPVRVCCRLRAGELFGFGSPMHIAMIDEEADELRRWRNKVHTLEAGLVQATNRREWTGLALAFSIILNVVLVAMLFR